MRYELLVAGLKGALFLEALPKALWPEKIYYYKVVGEVDEAHQRLISAVGRHSEFVNPSLEREKVLIVASLSYFSLFKLGIP